MPAVRTAHTSQLSPTELGAIRALLDGAFAGGVDGGFTDADWDHTVGGMHALVLEHGALVAHGSVVQRRLLHGGRALRTGYVEGVAVREDRRRQGHGSTVMAALERVVRGAYEIGALGATDEAARLYARRGWQVWQGRTFVLAPSGLTRTPDEDGAVLVLPVPGTTLDLSGDLVCDWRDGDVW